MSNFSCMWCKHLPMIRPFNSHCERGHLVTVKDVKMGAKAANKTVAEGGRGYRADDPPGFFTFRRPYPRGAGCLDFDCGGGDA
jgi:hypothetical protein